MKPKFDEIDAAHLDDCLDARANLEALDAPIVGDFVVQDGRGSFRVAHVWPDTIQLTRGGSFYMERTGAMLYSGGLEPGIDRERFTPAGQAVDQRAWFFHHGEARAHNGVEFWVPVRVWHLREEA